MVLAHVSLPAELAFQPLLCKLWGDELGSWCELALSRHFCSLDDDFSSVRLNAFAVKQNRARGFLRLTRVHAKTDKKRPLRADLVQYFAA
jgi:hypothetical protein